MSDRQGDTGPVAGRGGQRRRTRGAIVAAARDLLAQGARPSIDDIAQAADVSRRTIYMYFPTLNQLLLDAAAGLLSEATVDTRLGRAHHRGDVLARADALARSLVELAPEVLPLGRRILALTVDTEPPEEGTKRGYRRVEWIERAVEPLKDKLPADRYERLVSALAIVLGWEAMIVLRDVRGLGPAAEQDTIRWATRALVRAALDEAPPPSP